MKSVRAFSIGIAFGALLVSCTKVQGGMPVTANGVVIHLTDPHPAGTVANDYVRQPSTQTKTFQVQIPPNQ